MFAFGPCVEAVMLPLGQLAPFEILMVGAGDEELCLENTGCEAGNDEFFGVTSTA